MASNNRNTSEIVLKAALRTLVPINVLPTETFNEFAEHIELETAPAGSELFHYGDTSERVIYLLSGEVIMKDRHDSIIQGIRGGTERARYPLAHETPREATAEARTKIVYIQMNMHKLNSMMTDEYSIDHQIGDIRVHDIHDVHDDDWITAALQSSLFENLPPANMQVLLSHLKSVPVKKGEVVINQGEVANYYYYIRQGRCQVTRKPTGKDETEVLAVLQEGDGFGEEALIAYNRRNASITMMTNGILMRLSNADFKDLIEKPLLKSISLNELGKNIEHDTRILDVRSSSEYNQSHLPESTNIPYSRFREAIDSLEPHLEYIIYSNNGRRSAVAAFLLMQRGIKACYIKDRLTPQEDAPSEKAHEKDFINESFKNSQELEKLKEAYKALQQQLQQEHQLRQDAEKKSSKNKSVAALARLEAEKEMSRLAKEMNKLAQERKKLQAQQETSINSQALAEDIAALEAKKLAMQHELESFQKQVKDEAEHLENEVKTIQELEATRLEALEEIERIHAEATLAKQEAEAAHRSAEQEAKRLANETTKLVDLNESRAREEKKLAELESREHELKQIVSKRNEMKSELDALSAQLETARQDMDTVHQQIDKETIRLSELKTQTARQETIEKNNAELESQLEQLNNDTMAAQAKAEETQKKLRQQQALLAEMEGKAEEYKSLSEGHQSMQDELASLEAQLKTARQQVESTAHFDEANKLASELSTLQAKEEAVQIKADAEKIRLKAEEEVIQLKADAAQTHLQAREDVARAKAEAARIQLHAKAEVARIKSELAILRSQSGTNDSKD